MAKLNDERFDLAAEEAAHRCEEALRAGRPCPECGRAYHGDVCPRCGFGEAALLAYERSSEE